MSRPRCTVYEQICHEHEFIHGAEAEELRHGMEMLIARWCSFQGNDFNFAANDLQILLDRVDARDSLAYREATNA